ncbi:MAG: CHRD domain-containing protein [Candidatus Nitrosopolaris sp.]
MKGTVVLDSVPKTTSLNPGEDNPAIIHIINRGTAPARNVVAAIQPAVRNVVYPPAPVTLNTNATTGGQIITQNPPSLVPVVNVGSNTYHVGTIPPNGIAIINPIFHPDLTNLFTSGNAYVNVHTQQHQNGEIRGQVGPSSNTTATPSNSNMTLTPPANTTAHIHLLT